MNQRKGAHSSQNKVIRSFPPASYSPAFVAHNDTVVNTVVDVHAIQSFVPGTLFEPQQTDERY